jgi:hypothetical protein
MRISIWLVLGLGGCGSLADDTLVSLGTHTTGTTSVTTAVAAVPGLEDAMAWRALAGSEGCDGDYYLADLAVLDAAIDAATALKETSDDAAVEAAEAALQQALDGLEGQAISHTGDLEVLLTGVGSVVAPGGTPSQFGVVGCNGLAVFQSEVWAHPTIVAGRAGEGRMMLFAKEISSYLPTLEDQSLDAEMAKLSTNSLTWLTARNPSGYAASQASGTSMKVLVSHGYSSFDDALGLELVAIDSPLDAAALFDPTTHPLAIVNPRIEDPAEAALLLDYVQSGGALLMGHQVWTWYTDKEQSAGQSLIAEAGVLWRNWYGVGGGLVPEIEVLVAANTYHLLDWLDTVEADWANHVALGYDPEDADDVVAYVVDSYQWLPLSSSLVEPLQGRYDEVSVVYPADLAERPYTRAMVPLYHQVMELAPDQMLGKGVATFPGLVDAAAVRFDGRVTYDFDRRDPSYLETPVEPRARMATGFYAPPAENLTITVAALGGLDVASGLGLRLIVGPHSDNLSSQDVLDRPPLVSFSTELEVGAQVVNNPYGGLIYLEADPGDFRAGQAEVVLSGVVQAPTYVQGLHTNTDWPQLLIDGPAPWGDIVAPTMISTLPREQLDLVTDPESLAQAWADIVMQQYDFMGLDDALGAPHLLPQGTHHFVEDVQISAGWMHSGYPIMAFTAAELHLWDNIASWGPYHELGHNNQQPEWKMTDSGEVSNNLYSLYCQEQFGQGSRLADQYTYASADAALAGGADWSGLDVWERLTFYRRLSLAYGWDFYRDLVRQTRQLHADTGSGLAAGQTPEDFVLVEGSRIAGEDLTTFFDVYGLILSQDARDQVAAMGLPQPIPPLTTYAE